MANMAYILLSAISFFLVSPIPVSAVPNVTVTQIGKGNCIGYPNSYFHTGDNADAFIFSPDQTDNATFNGLSTGVYGTSLVVYEDKTVASIIFCCDRGTILDGFGVQSLLLSTGSNDEELGYFGQGIEPETYTHEVDGVTQDGVFLGMANVTTWAFKRAAANSDYYQIRLLVPGGGNTKGQSLYDGEFEGFLKIVPP